MSDIEIKWGERPEGATHYWPRKGLRRAWLRALDQGKCALVWDPESRHWLEVVDPLPPDAVPVPTRITEWDEGEKRMEEIGRNSNDGLHYGTTAAQAVKGYDSLYRVLRDAYDQASIGKGEERHANGKAFEDQPMQKLIDLYGVGFAHGQAAKKMQEAQGMLLRGEVDKAIHEVLGAINYAAGAIISMKKQQEKNNV